MKLSIDNILPTYFEESRKATSQIWGKHIEIPKGEKLHIVAPSGTGKTSLIHFLYKLRTSYSGSISYDTQDLANSNNEVLANLRKNHISIILQDMRLFGEQTILQNLEIKRQLNPFHPTEKIHELAAKLGITHRLNQLAKNCSYGEQQRAVIIRALLQPFDILLMDEPFSHLDNHNTQLALELIIEEANTRKATVIYAELEQSSLFPTTQLLHL
ncbi:MAG: ATP-binding cassette domain-containing protein [Chitinophagaceae bacterium]|nr:MAG: ATP-binding cassette domain-containing protein [Chitinophagaceae bacterium]